MKKCKLQSRIYDVVTFEEYVKNKDNYDPGFVSIQDGDYIYPVRSKNSDAVGVYPISNAIYKFNDPVDEKDKEEYSIKNIINFEDAGSLKEIIEKSNQLKSAERTILTTPDNITIPVIGEHDSPEMVGLKEAVISKQIDIDKYQGRFGSNFSNDKRLLNGSEISIRKLRTMFKAFDMKGTLIIEDLNDDVPNPIGKKIVVDLLGGDSDESI